MIQGNELYQLLYEKTSEKFNPMKLEEKLIESEGVQIEFQEFKESLRRMRDKKSHGADGLPALTLKRMGSRDSFKFFS